MSAHCPEFKRGRGKKLSLWGNGEEKCTERKRQERREMDEEQDWCEKKED